MFSQVFMSIGGGWMSLLPISFPGIGRLYLQYPSRRWIYPWVGMSNGAGISGVMSGGNHTIWDVRHRYAQVVGTHPPPQKWDTKGYGIYVFWLIPLHVRGSSVNFFLLRGDP